MSSRTLEKISQVVVRFAGDSGDGMQLTGSQFSDTSALVGNDLSTYNDYPAEIRAPAGTLYGVSGFQLCFGDHQIHTPGDSVDVLVAMNPASLKVSLSGVKSGGVIIVNEDSFTERNLQLAGYEVNPLDDESLSKFRVVRVPLASLSVEAVKDLGLNAKSAARGKNMFALGLMYWVYTRPLEPTIKFLESKFSSNKEILEANIRLLKAGYHYGETIDLFTETYEVVPAKMSPGTYRSVSGTQSMAYGLVAASVQSKVNIFFGSYPITPASDLLHELSRHKNFGVKTFQAEDEIAAICAAIGASYGGHLGVTSTSGPGFALKAEAMGLALMVELPLVVVNNQRGGPSTGLPTKTEQSDLFQAMYGRNGESPVAIVSVSRPNDCFEAAFEAARLAIKYRHPVVLLTEGAIANGTEPWCLPDIDELPKIDPLFAPGSGEEDFLPYSRDPKTLARPWATPGVPGNEHRIGGLEKEDLTGHVSYDPENHEKMVRIRAQKIAGIAADIPDQEVYGSAEGEVLILGWGGSFGALRAATDRLQEQGCQVSHAHLRYLNPFPQNLEEVLGRFKTIFIPELNSGQLAAIIRAKFLVPTESYSKVQGRPFTIEEIEEEVKKLVGVSV